MVHKRYANPYPLLDDYVRCGALVEFVVKIVDAENEDRLFDVWKTRVLDKDFATFRRNVGFVKNADRIKAKRRDAAAEAIAQTLDITKNIAPS